MSWESPPGATRVRRRDGERAWPEKGKSEWRSAGGGGRGGRRSRERDSRIDI